MAATSNAEIARLVEGWTVPRRFLATVAGNGDAPALRWQEDDGFAVMSFAAYAERAARVAAALAALGVRRGTRVAMLVGNRPEFHIADMAIMFTGATPVSIYNSSSPEQIASLARHCGAEVILVEHEEYLQRVLKVRDQLADVRHLVVVDAPRPARPRVSSRGTT